MNRETLALILLRHIATKSLHGGGLVTDHPKTKEMPHRGTQYPTTEVVDRLAIRVMNGAWSDVDV
jgi:hypothetical protein